jgi:hypothetical protein
VAAALSCESVPLGWDPLAPASPLAALATALTGLVVACLVAVAAGRGRRHRFEIVALLGSALACLAVAGFAGWAVAQEPSCLFGWAENMFGTAGMSVAAVAVCCGLAWLLRSYLGPDRMLMATSRWCGYLMIMIVTLFQELNAKRFRLDTVGAWSGPGWTGWFVVGYAPLTLAGLVLVRACWLARPRRLAGEPPHRLDRPARIAALVTSTFALISLVGTAVIAGQPVTGGVVVPTWVLDVGVAVPMLLAAGPTLVLAYALPHPLPRHRAAAPTPPPGGDRAPDRAVAGTATGSCPPDRAAAAPASAASPADRVRRVARRG